MNFDDLFQRRLLLVTGKGGIGKSLVTASLAYQACQRGLKVLLVESSAEGQLSPLFGRACAGHHIQELAAGISAINIDMQLNFRDFVVTHLGFEQLFQRVFNQKLVQSFLRMIPGLAELTLLGRLYYESQVRRLYDLVLFDGFASGHFLQLMTTPQAVFDAGLVGPILHETKKIHAMLGDLQETGVVMITEPENLIVSECLDFMQQMAERSPAQVQAVLVNRAFADQVSAGALSAAATHYPQLSLLLQLIDREQRQVWQHYLRLQQGLQEIATKFQHSYVVKPLPDLGAVTEPLARNVALSFFQQAELLISGATKA